MIIAVDAMGGEYAPHEIVKGAIKAAQEYHVEIALVGKKDVLHVQAGRHLAKLNMTIVNATESIDFHESSIEAVQSKPDSSIVVGTNLVRDGHASAFVSAGHSGAMLYSALVSLGKVKGIDRPPVGSIINMNTAGPVLLLDAGANADCRPGHLVQFAQLGAIYARELFGIASPRVGLLSNGEEESKGNHLTKVTHQLLKQISLNFIGNVEGHDITHGAADVIVTDGFTGNVVLKTLEGMGDAFLKLQHVGRLVSRAYHLQGHDLLLDVGLGSLAKRMNYREYGGACLLGVNGNIIFAHGRSQATTIKNAIGLAKQTVERNIKQKIKEATYEQASPSE